MSLLTMNPIDLGNSFLMRWQHKLFVALREYVLFQTDMRAIDVNKWTFSHDGGHRYGVMMTNISEAINGVLKGTRRLPITAIVNATFTRSKNAFQEREEDAKNLQQRNQTWPEDVFNRITDNNALGMRHTVDLYNHSRQIASVTVRVQHTTSDITGIVPECYSTIEYAMTYTSGFFAPLADVEDWGEPNF
ncbi:hypothetical protein ACS0TY_001167 [Phlomoides rotata]